MYWFAGKRVNCLTMLEISPLFFNTGAVCGCGPWAYQAKPLALLVKPLKRLVQAARVLAMLSLCLCLPAVAVAQTNDQGYAEENLARDSGETGNGQGQTIQGQTVATYAGTRGSSKAAQLYQDARYDYSMGYLGSAINNLKQLITTYPRTPFAEQGRKDLEMLYAEVRRARALQRRNPARRVNRRVTSGGMQGDDPREQTAAGTSESSGTSGTIGVGTSIAARYTPAAGPLSEENSLSKDDALNEEDSLSPFVGNAPGGAGNPITGVLPRPKVFARGTQLQGRAIGTRGLVEDDRSNQSIAGWSYKIMTLGAPKVVGQARLAILEKGVTATKIRAVKIAEPEPAAKSSASAPPAGMPRSSRQKQKAANFRRYNAAFKSASSDRIFFGPQSIALESRARSVIAAQAVWLKSHGDLTVAIEGHADEGGSRQQDRIISRRRAEAVRKYLVANGVKADHIIIKAHGRAARISLCAASFCAAQNRRVVTKIVVP